MGVVAVQQSGLERARVEFAERVAERLYHEVTGSAVPERRRSAAWLAFALAMAGRLVTLGCLLVAGWTAVLSDGATSVVAAIVLICLVDVAWRWVGRYAPRDGAVIDPAAAPGLYELAGEVARSLGVRPVWRIVQGDRFDASIAEIGFRRRHVLFLGRPLWDMLDPGERIALLGHEFGHVVNGDALRGLGTDCPLRKLYRRLPARLSRPLLGLILVQERVFARACQRAEYRADQVAVRVAGRVPVLSLLEKTRAAESEPPWLDATHPPISLRIAAISQFHDGDPGRRPRRRASGRRVGRRRG
jgi:Zn-dependent protease with chaperone function